MHSPSKDGVELFASSRNLQHTLALLTEFMCGLKAAACRLKVS